MLFNATLTVLNWALTLLLFQRTYVWPVHFILITPKKILMGTNNKTRTGLIVALAALISMPATLLLAQNSKTNSDDIHIRIITQENGNESVIDTVFPASDKAAAEQFMKSHHIDAAINGKGQQHLMFNFSDGKSGEE